TPEPPESLDQLLQSSPTSVRPHHPDQSIPHQPSNASPYDGHETSLNRFNLWRTATQDSKMSSSDNHGQHQQQRGEQLQQLGPTSTATQSLGRVAQKLASLVHRTSAQVFRVEKPERDLGNEDDEDEVDPDDLGADGKPTPSLTTFGLMALTISLAGAQLAWTLELAYGTPYLLSLGLTKQSTSLVWIAGPLSGLVCQPIIGSLSDASTSRFRRRQYMLASAVVLILSTLALAFSVPIATWLVDLTGGGIGDWDPKRKGKVHEATQWISVGAFWILDFALNGLQASSRALILDTAPAKQQTLANAWHGRMTHAGNVAGYLAGWLDLSSWKGLRWVGGGQFRRFALVSVTGMISATLVTVCSIQERPSAPDHTLAHSGWSLRAREILRNIWQTIRRLPRPVRRVCAVQIFAFMGWFPFLFYSTTYVLEAAVAEEKAAKRSSGEIRVGSGQPYLVQSPESDKVAERGSFAMLLFALVALTSGALLPYLMLASEHRRKRTIALTGGERTPTAVPSSPRETYVPGMHGDEERRSEDESDVEELAAATAAAALVSQRMTLRQKVRRSLTHGITLRSMWTLGSLTFSLLMAATFLVRTVRQATALIALVGIPWSIASWIPFAMVAEFVREAEEGKSPFEFEGDHWSPARTMARRRLSVLSRRNQMPQEGEGILDGSPARKRLDAALVDCQPLLGGLESGSSSHNQTPSRTRGGRMEGMSRSGGMVEEDVEIGARAPQWATRLHCGRGQLQDEGGEGPTFQSLTSYGQKFGGTILGIHNLSIVLPQFVVAVISSIIFRLTRHKDDLLVLQHDQQPSSLPTPALLHLLPGLFGMTDQVGSNDSPGSGVAWVLRFGGSMALIAALATRYVPLTMTERKKR
ncbi:MFS general substrate transporter, partial [Violaceomyces palustris]